MRYGVGTDISLAALRTARANAADLALADRAGFVACDYAAALSGRFDLIVSNPPYIRSADIADSQPRCAITTRCVRWTAAPTDLTPIARIIPQAARLLAPRAPSSWKSGTARASDVEAIDERGRVNASRCRRKPIWRASRGRSRAENCPDKA